MLSIQALFLIRNKTYAIIFQVYILFFFTNIQTIFNNILPYVLLLSTSVQMDITGDVNVIENGGLKSFILKCPKARELRSFNCRHIFMYCVENARRWAIYQEEDFDILSE